MTNRFRIHGSLGRRLEELGVSPVSVLRRAGLPMGLFDQSKILVTTEEMFALYSAVREISDDPGIGLKLGSEERPERYSPVAIAALYSRSFGDALKRIARYKRTRISTRDSNHGGQKNAQLNSCGCWRKRQRRRHGSICVLPGRLRSAGVGQGAASTRCAWS